MPASRRIELASGARRGLPGKSLEPLAVSRTRK
jgi:hypothetical protein